MSVSTQYLATLVAVSVGPDNQATAWGSDPLADPSTRCIGIVASPVVTTPVIAPSVSRTNTGAKRPYLNPRTSRTRAEIDLGGGRSSSYQRGRCQRSKDKCFHCSTPFFSSWPY